MPAEHFDVLIVGAGLSGIGAGVSPADALPGPHATRSSKAASAIGGTWDLFRYPGIRSDSDMYTLGYSFQPWEDAKAIADGPSILKYVTDTAREYGIDRKIRFGHQVRRASWSTQDARWTVEAERGSAKEPVTHHLQLPLHVQRLLQLRGGLHAGVPRHGALRGPHRPSAEVDRGHRLRGQARRRDRQRRHGGDAGARDWRRPPRT